MTCSFNGGVRKPLTEDVTFEERQGRGEGGVTWLSGEESSRQRPCDGSTCDQGETRDENQKITRHDSELGREGPKLESLGFFPPSDKTGSPEKILGREEP